MWKVLNRQVLHDAMPWVRLSSEHVRLPNGVEIENFYRVDITPFVMIFAQREDGCVAMIEHYKHGPQTISLEIPAGYIEDAGDPLGAARRELREETGLVSEDWQSLGRQFIDGNRGCGWVYGFLARNATRAGAPQPEDTEIMTVHFKSLDEIYDLWRADQIFNVAAVSIIGRSLLELGYLGKMNGGKT
jgi:8-oxo-dGTP pyrophosphatase MutT (NUDIX family)